MSSRTVDLSETQLGDWSLLGAGRANAVFVYDGPRPEMAGRVLRLSKPKLAARPCAAVSLEEEVWKDHEELLQQDTARRFIYFANTFLAPFMPRRYLPDQVIAHTGPELAAGLLESIGQSPDNIPKTAMLLPNNTMFGGPTSRPVVCVELKPKWGALPTSKAIHPDHALKQQTSKFCLQQALKLAQGKIDQMGTYDPIDLFSGEPDRVAVALCALLRAPQNNLQLFRDGRPAPFSGLDTEDGARELTQALSDWCDDTLLPNSAAVVSAAIQAVLFDSGVLEQLLRIQNLDKHDIEGVAPLYDMLLQRHTAPTSPPHSPGSTSCSQDSASSSESSQSRSSMQSPSDVSVPVGTCRKRQTCSALERDAAVTEWNAAHALLRAMPRGEQCDVLRSYMTAVTAKDCSVMIALRPLKQQPPVVSEEAHGTITVDSQDFEYKISIADLDCKPLEKIREHQRLDADILAAAMNMKEAKLLSGGF